MSFDPDVRVGIAIGGPADGQMLMGRSPFRYTQTPPPSIVTDRPLGPPPSRKEFEGEYRHERLGRAGIWVHESLTPEDAIERLLLVYQGGVRR